MAASGVGRTFRYVGPNDGEQASVKSFATDNGPLYIANRVVKLLSERAIFTSGPEGEGGAQCVGA